MSPSLKVSLGPNVDELKEISYNDASSHSVKSKLFDGIVSVHVKGDFSSGDSSKNTYFNYESRERHTWSIGIQGKHENTTHAPSRYVMTPCLVTQVAFSRRSTETTFFSAMSLIDL
jgi:hypothetical protein